MSIEDEEDFMSSEFSDFFSSEEEISSYLSGIIEIVVDASWSI
jgi:hypothetical protein